MDELTPLHKNWLQSWNLEIEVNHFFIAITHPSYHAIDPTATDYERYEFLGDACLDLLAAEQLFNSEHILSQGEMTRRRTNLVKNEQLALIFDVLQLKEIILTAVHYSPSMKDKANFVEALFGAVFISKGYSACKGLWKKIQDNIQNPKELSPLFEDHIHPRIRDRKTELEILYAALELIPKDPITTLQELCLKNKRNLPKYKLIQRRGPDHKPLFAYQVLASPFHNFLDEEFTAVGKGSSKQKAKFDAAARLCEQIHLPYTPV